MTAADDVFQRGYILGAPSDWHDIDLSTITGRLSIDGQTVQTGREDEVMGNSLEAVVWPANASPRIGCPLRRGHVVLTGSMQLVYWLGTTAEKSEWTSMASARCISGFLPVQSVYADFYVVYQHWADFRPEHFDDALRWFKEQDRTLGG